MTDRGSIHLSDFTVKVIKRIRSIPAGKVATYKQIAELAGKPHASRGVSWILSSCSRAYQLPWHRVLSSQGKISFEKGSHNFRQQKKRLENEGVIFSEGGHLNLKKFQWKKKGKRSKVDRNKPKMFD